MTSSGGGATATDPRPLLRWCLRRRRRGLVVAALLGIATEVALVATPWAVQRGLDAGVVAGDGGALAWWAAATVALGVAAALLDRGSTRHNYATGAAAVADVRRRLLDAVLRLDRAALASTGRGDLLSRNGRDTDLLWQWIGGVVDTVTLAVTVPIIVVAIARLDPLLAIVGAATVPLLAVLAFVFPRRYETANRTLATAHGARGDVVEALVTGSVAIRGLGGEGPLLDAHHRSSRTITDETVTVARLGSWWAASAELVPAVGLTIGLVLGGLAALDGDLTIGGLVAFTTWMGMLAARVSLLVARQVSRREARVGVGRIAEVLDRVPDVGPADGTPVPDHGVLDARGVLEARGVVVGDGDGHRAGPVDLAVAPGELVAITGPTGSGKSSFLRSLVRLDARSAGEVAYRGTDLTAADDHALRGLLHLVPQRPLLVSGTVRDNLRLGAPDATDDELWRALHAVAVDEEVGALPGALDASVGERGTSLSGGQVQRLALARGLLTGAAVLLLDDVTSAVDTPTEATILDRVRTAAPDRALVVVSHRDGVLASADRVVTLTRRGGTLLDDPAPGGRAP